jgi:hypothetical protein
MKYNKSEIMKKAWNIFRSTKHSFSESLRRAWAWAKSLVPNEVRYAIPDWFMNKNMDKVTTAHLVCFQTFDKYAIKKETEKAYYVELDMMTREGFESKYTKKIWVPKSILRQYLV